MIHSGAVGGATPPTLGAELRAAAARGDVAACRRHLGAARLVRFSRDEHGRTALHLAAANGHREVVRLLLSVAAPREVDGPDGAGCSALQRAAASGHEEVITLVLARGAEVNGQDSVHGNTALHEASWKGHSKSVRLLASAGADLNRCNGGGFTALHLSCQNGHNQSCRELLLAGCNPDIQNNYGDTALHTAARYGHAGVTRILISAQCRVSEQNKNGDTALHISSAMGRRKLTRILLEAGCEKSVRNKQGETARDIAMRKDLFEILDILDEGGVGREGRKGIRGTKKRSKSKVKFEDAVDSKEVPHEQPKPWSPYGCHYFPDPKNFPSPRLDSLPQEPLKKGEQYYLDLAGKLLSMDELDPPDEDNPDNARPSVKELVARIQQLNCQTNNGNDSESSDEEELPVRKKPPAEPSVVGPSSLDFPGDAPPRSRTGVYSPTIVNSVMVNQNPRYIEPIVEIREGTKQYSDSYGVYPPQLPVKRPQMYQTDLGFVEPYKIQYYDNAVAERRVLNSAKVYENDPAKPPRLEMNYAGTNVPDNVDRDTNNDSGYSTKVYGSSKGNSPSLCGKIDGDGLGASSLV
uniref:Ankyrin repeat and KH domain-containing protein CBG24701 n=1 Tax=Diabrotica virgifera virgifera TaxID=50390 RepID=A0A6P7FR79_DIAVI